jgi:hypothetical protein
MDEAEWQSCQDPAAMLEHARGWASDRRLRLFAVACCRRVWQAITAEHARAAIEVTERFADGLATQEELASAVADAAESLHSRPLFDQDAGSFLAVRLAALAGSCEECFRWICTHRPDYASATTWYSGPTRDLCEYAAWVAQAAARAGASPKLCRPPEGEVGQKKQAKLLRCIFGNPFKPLSSAPAVLASQGSIVVRMATAIYEERRWDDLPFLADALEEAGCSDSNVLAHCRGEGPHARGCHVVDSVLGRS